MLLSHRWLSFATGILCAAWLAGCGGTVSSSSGGGSGGQTATGGSGGVTSTGGGGAGGTTATGGTGEGGSITPLANQGVAQKDCAPNDGPAILFAIGTPSVCNDTPNAAAQVRLLAYPGDFAGLAVGMKWGVQGGQGEVTGQFYPDGNSGAAVNIFAAEVDILDVTDTEVHVYYYFQGNAVNYGGEATLLKCDVTPLCG